MQKSTAYRKYTKICFHDDERWSSKKSNLPPWSRRGLSSVFWNQQGCKCTQTELGYKCLFMSLGVSVTWPKTTATQKGKTVPATCQPRPRTWCARKPCEVMYEHGCQGLGRVSCEGRCQGLPVLVPDSSAAASTGITEWLRMEVAPLVVPSILRGRQAPPLEVTWPNLPAQAEPSTKADCLGPCPSDSWVSAHMETPQPLQAICASAPSPWH